MNSPTNESAFEELARAVHGGDAATVRSVLGTHPDLRARLDEALPEEGFGATALLAAVHAGNRAVVDVLLDAGANINQRSHWWAGSFGVLDNEGPLASYLVERGARVDGYAAARHGWMDRLRALVAADPEEARRPGGDGQTPLHVAANVDVAALLLEHGAGIDTLDVDHESTPAQYQIKERPGVSRLLVDRGAKTDILLAAALGDLALVRRHLEANPAAIRCSVSHAWFPMANPRAGGTIYIWTLGWNQTAHSIARNKGHQDVFRFLWEQSPDALRLAVAAELGMEAEMRELLAARPGLAASLAPEDQKRLVAAAVDNDVAAVRRMLAAGWPVNVIGHENATVAHWAAFHGNLEMLREVLRYHPDLTIKDGSYEGTPLNWAQYGSRNGWYRETGDYAGVIAEIEEA